MSVDRLYVEPGYNVREIDQAHVEEFRDAYIAGEQVPALAVQVTEQGIKIIDAHHRYYGAKLAREAGHDIRLECKDFVGSEADRIAFMVTSSQGCALEPLERAAAYQRLVNQGWEPAQIAKKVKRSITDVENHLALLTSGDELIALVKNKEVAATTAVALVREHGAAAGRVAKTELEKAKATGKKKLTKAAALPQFDVKRSRLLVELLAKNCQAEQDEEGTRINLMFETDLQVAEVMDIIQAAREHYGVTTPDSEQPPAPAEPANDGDDLPLTKHDILEQSGVEIWACIQAAFKMKSQYTYAESKYAHTWAADSVEHPEHVVVPEETVQSALRLIQQYQDDQAIKQWLCEQHDDLEVVEEQLQRFSSVLISLRQEQPCTAQEFIELVKQTHHDCWSNYRLLRQAIREIASQLIISDIGEPQ